MESIFLWFETLMSFAHFFYLYLNFILIFYRKYVLLLTNFVILTYQVTFPLNIDNTTHTASECFTFFIDFYRYCYYPIMNRNRNIHPKNCKVESFHCNINFAFWVGIASLNLRPLIIQIFSFKFKFSFQPQKNCLIIWDVNEAFPVLQVTLSNRILLLVKVLFIITSDYLWNLFILCK